MGFLRLANALVVFLAALLPLMLVLGAGEGTPQRPTLLFWLVLLLPLLLLPWLWRTLEPEDAADGQTVAARRIEPDATQAEAFAELVAPAVDVRRARMADGVARVDGQLRDAPAHSFAALERLLAPKRLTPLVQDARPMVVGPHEDVVQALRQVQGDLLTNRRASDGDAFETRSPRRSAASVRTDRAARA